MLLMHVVFNGEIILPAPSWVSYEPQAEIAKNKVHWIETTLDNNWFPTAKQHEDKIKSIGKKNIILILNSPNNPSGSVCNNLNQIANVAKQNNIKIGLITTTTSNMLNSISNSLKEHINFDSFHL